MDPHAWAKAKSLLATVADLPVADRLAFLEMHCTDAALRAELIAMLDAPAALSDITLGARPLEPGTELGPYRVDRLIGRGGMGEVYKARDTRLGRDVAIKVLPAALGDDPERLRRFHQEAHILAALNHPHIATIHGLEEISGLRLLIMEFIDGDSLAQRIARGPLSFADVARLAIGIAEALDAAHRAGVVHRDLTPANVMLGPAAPKLLDFGLAKARLPDMATETTADGTILGTLHYMAPEQVEGRAADARSDIFAFGCVLYEMLTRHRAFDAPSPAGIVSAILKEDPQPVSTVRPDTPPALEHIVARCLAKETNARWQTARDLLEELRWVAAAGSARGVRRWRRSALAMVPWAIAGLAVCAVAVAAAVFWARTSATVVPAPPVRSTMEPPPGYRFAVATALSLTPDGSRVAFRAVQSGSGGIFVQTLATGEAAPVANSAEADITFFSPDGRQIGLCGDRTLRAIDLGGGNDRTLIAGEAGRPCFGATWAGDGTILYASRGGVRAIPSGGGAASVVLSPRPPVVAFMNPTALPDGRHFLVFGDTTTIAGSGIYVADMGTHDATFVAPSSSAATYVSPGYLIFVRQKQLLAQPFDLRTLTLSGAPVVLAGNVRAGFAASNAGVIMYFEREDITELVWMSRAGERLGRIGVPRAHLSPRLSPAGDRLAYGLRFDSEAPGLWVHDFALDSDTRVSDQHDGSPVWSADGSQLAFDRVQEAVGIRPSAGSGDQMLLRRPWVWPSDWSPDGRYLAYTYDERQIIGIRQLSPPVDLEFPQAGRASNFDAHFSPDGRWLAYTSDEGGKYDVWVVDFPRATRKWKVSTDGGAQARWPRDAHELTYVAPGGYIMSVAVDTRGGLFAFRKAVPLFAAPFGDWTASGYDVTSDGQRFVINARPSNAQRSLRVLTNWTALLPRK